MVFQRKILLHLTLNESMERFIQFNSVFPLRQQNLFETQFIPTLQSKNSLLHVNSRHGQLNSRHRIDVKIDYQVCAWVYIQALKCISHLECTMSQSRKDTKSKQLCSLIQKKPSYTVGQLVKITKACIVSPKDPALCNWEFATRHFCH